MKNLSRLGSLGAIAIIAAACSTSATPTPAPVATPAPTTAPVATTAGTPAPAASATAAGLTGKLTVWDGYATGSAEAAAMDAVVAKAKTTFPGLTITDTHVPFDQLFNKITAAWASGETSPDMFIAPNDSLGSEQRQGILYGPMDDVLKPYLSNFTQIAIDGSKVNGHIYEIPESLKAISMFYDKSKVTAAPKTTDDLLALAKAGTKIGFGEYAAAYYNWWVFNAFGGGPVMDSTGKCVADTNGTSDGLAFLKALKDTGNVKFETSATNLQGDFKTGAVSLVFDGPWVTGDYEKALGSNLAIAVLPAGPKGKALPLSAPDGWYLNVNASDSQKALAVQYALWEVSLTGGEQTFADQAGHLPAAVGATVKDPISQGFLTQINDSYPRPQTKNLDNYWTPWGNAFDSVLLKGTDPVKAATDACAQMNKANKIS
jgi:arabinogalactan oligomer/maltooligosaccharide transport system substrate-binding protein